jgi:hypothetical protein
MQVMWPLPRRVRLELEFHLVGYLYEDYHDALSLEHKVGKYQSTLKNSKDRSQGWDIREDEEWGDEVIYVTNKR